MGGESDPKARPFNDGVVDGKQVNIPVLIVTGPEGRRRLSWVCLRNVVEALKARQVE
jgi:hypothetical protein